MAVNKNEHLNKVLETHRMAHIDVLLEKHKLKRNEIKEALETEFNSKIYSPFNSGSFGKHTAINTKFDLDIVAPFKKDSFSTIEDMFNEVYDFLFNKYHSTGQAEVRKQKVSIGVIFKTDSDGDQISIDVVPGRELTQDTYLQEKDLNIYFNESKWGVSKGSYMKTNIQAQIDHIKGRDSERKVIRLLKIWKNSNREDFKSFMLELISIKAFDKSTIEGNLWDKLKGVMAYIRDNVTNQSFTLIDPGNSNNDVMKLLSSSQREYLSNRMKIIINNIEANPENIKSYFPINEDFEISDEDSNSYGLKGSTTPFSIPIDNQRFG